VGINDYRNKRIGILIFLVMILCFSTPAFMNSSNFQSINHDTSTIDEVIIPKLQKHSSVASDEVYNEDFTTTTYRDAAATDVSGWGTGTLRFVHNTPTIVGSCDTLGNAYGVCVDGDYVYVADDAFGLQVINITDPSNPTIAGTCDTPGNAWGLTVDGDYAYIADGDSGLQVINITEPSNPTIAGTCDTPGYAYGLYVDGDFAYVADSVQGLQVINITDPSNPSIIGGYSAPQLVYSVCVDGDFAYITMLEYGMYVINITNPSNPTFANYCINPGQALGMSVDGDYAYVANLDYGLWVINITEPCNPSSISSCDTPDWAWDVSLDGDYAYIADGDSGLQVINITEPSNPSMLGFCDTPGYVYGVCVDGDYAYIADGDSGLQVIKIADYTPPVSISSCSTPSYSEAVYVSGNYAYIAGYESGLQVINITDPSNPSLVGSYDTPGYAADVCVDGNYAYVADSSSYLLIINITDPSHPSLVISYGGVTYNSRVCVDGNYAYLASSSSGLQVVNITNPSNPSLVGVCNTPGSARSVFVSGNYAYVADFLQGLQVINITDPSHPSLVSFFNTTSYAVDVSVDGDYAYVADRNQGLYVINITDPSHPSQTYLYSITNAWTQTVFVRGDYAYVGDGNSLLVLNRTNLSQLSFVDSYDTPSSVFDVLVNGDYAYVANAGSGLQVVEVQRNRFRQYISPAGAQSKPIYSSSSISLVSATLTATATLPIDTSITYAMSADGGFHWESVIAGTEHTFINAGNTLLWQAAFTTTNSIATPLLEALVITYTMKSIAPILSSPSNGTLIADSTPTFNWSLVSGAENYSLQLDTDTSFTTPNLHNLTVVTPPYVLPSPLTDGTWYWRVAGNDSAGDLGTFSEMWLLTIDTTAPTWDQIPSNQVIEFGDAFRYDLNASDLTSIDSWSLNDTIQFAIDTTGLIANITPLSIGSYGLQVWVNDTYDHVQTATFTVTVQDTTAPIWDQTPTDRVVEFGDVFRYDLNASDLQGISSYWLNDTTYFAIDSTGLITNVTFVPVGTYPLEIKAYDDDSNYCSANITITITDTTTPTWSQLPTDQLSEYGADFAYQVSAIDLSGINAYWVNDTAYFDVDSTGLITNVTLVPVGTYALEIKAYDVDSNYCSANITIAVTDTIIPLWLSVPDDTVIDYGVDFSFQFAAYDLSGIGSWYVNDDLHFTIEDGILSNITTLVAGIYNLSVVVTDTQGNNATVWFTLTVLESTITTSSPTTTTTTASSTIPVEPIEFGQLVVVFGGFGLAIIIVLFAYFMERRKSKSTIVVS